MGSLLKAMDHAGTDGEHPLAIGGPTQYQQAIFERWSSN